jgi:hypothetical protein
MIPRNNTKYMTTKKQNKNLHDAKRNKNDEFYTGMTDIEKELSHYKNHFEGKTVLCNCDDPSSSNFVRYFALNFEQIRLKRIISTHYENDKPSYWIEINHKVKSIEEIEDLPKLSLKENGDFRSNESVAFLKQSDIVVTNPPFSLFREYMSQLIQYDKKFLIIGSFNAITYKDVFNLIKDNLVWLGYNSVKEFTTPGGQIQKFGNIIWYTNLTHKKRNEEIILFRNYYGNEEDYPMYDNHAVIEVSKVVNIPKDYMNVMGVPITFLDKYNPDQFKILGIANNVRWIGYECQTIIDGREIYNRILIVRQ